ncbi:MAG TPA: urease subunit gamma [Actinomycetes bacterium]|nr:urease subunit gamma [Actinomycetes bacterium]
MRLTPTERDRLLIFTAAELARARKARGLPLNAPEATAIVADTVIESARDGQRLRDAVDAACNVLEPDDVLPGVAALVPEVWVEAVFDDGSRLVVVPEPLGPAHGDAIPGSVHPANDEMDAATAATLHVDVQNTSGVPISVTSHFHFFEVNPRLSFDRGAAYGMRLAIDAGEAIRFDPGATVTVGLAPIGGERVIIGFAGLVDGPLDADGAKEAAIAKARATGYHDTESATDGGSR